MRRRRSLHGESHGVGVEYAVWAAEAGLDPRNTLAGLGLDWRGHADPSWQDVADIIAIQWRRLTEHCPWARQPRQAA